MTRLEKIENFVKENNIDICKVVRVKIGAYAIFTTSQEYMDFAINQGKTLIEDMRISLYSFEEVFIWLEKHIKNEIRKKEVIEQLEEEREILEIELNNLIKGVYYDN